MLKQEIERDDGSQESHLALDIDGTGAISTQPLQRFGLWGFLPFAVLAVWLAAIADDHVWRAGTILLLSAYASLVLSFLAGLRCGIAISSRSGQTGPDLAVTLLPAAIAWIAIAFPPHIRFAVLAMLFAAQGAWDSIGVSRGAVPEWLGAQRLRLTLLAVAAMILAAVATA